MDDKKKDIEFEIVTGDGSEIEISPLKEHLNAIKPKIKGEKNKKKIVIPNPDKKAP